MKSPKQKNKIDKSKIDYKVKSYFESEKELLNKLGLSKRLVVLFPHRRFGAPSLFGSLLLMILRSQGGILDTEFSLKKDK